MAIEAGVTLRMGCSNEITEQIDRLQTAIGNSRLRGSRIVVVKRDTAGVHS